MGYIASDLAFAEVSEVREHITPYKSNQYIMQLIYSYVKKYPGKIGFQQALITDHLS
jgi:DNA polymerase-3 subunit epsilon